MESLQYLLGAGLNSVEWMRHWQSGEEEHDGESLPCGDVRVVFTVPVSETMPIGLG